MTNYFEIADKNLAESEQLLLKEEEKLASQLKTAKATKISSSEIKNTPYVCGISFYRIQVQNKNGFITQSTYAVENKQDQCKTPPINQLGRQSWFAGNLIGDN